MKNPLRFICAHQTDTAHARDRGLGIGKRIRIDARWKGRWWHMMKVSLCCRGNGALVSLGKIGKQ